ncbi:hypothetical protein [Flaviaesturariibacter aridisoli]|uniref:Uncharacterized protein n=1 Tax=Flaviaesturariibacter aridisoli TaxID=2545761 RepID=A0A4R4DY49_9BACT|nr:hypothetical protein [Flaviaesturariibacter aridisoli]TCZ70461.1 hypothetical protein E0486_10925 [Flaviaesturariibacter aridisoli]
MANTNPRIRIPQDPKGLLALAGDVSAQHVLLGAASPLNAMEDNNWTQVLPDLQKATSLQEKITAMERQLEELYGERNRYLPAIKGAVTASRDALKGTYAKNLKKLGEFGFTVDHTPKAKKVTG